MATYYVDYVNGADANNGLGPDASHASNKPWKTLAKLLGASGMGSGDTAYLSPAGPFRETVSIALPVISAETKIIGDPLNVQGFRTSGGVLVPPGPVIHTGYTTNDKTTPAAAQLITNTNNRNYLTWEKIEWIAGSSQLVGSSTATNWTFRDCALFRTTSSATPMLAQNTTFGNAANHLIERCIFVSAPGIASGYLYQMTLPRGTGADYDTNVILRDCVFFGGGSTPAIYCVSSGAGANFGGGVRVRNCTFLFSSAIQTSGSTSTSIPCTVANSFIYSVGNVALSAGTAGQITEDYNLIVSGGGTQGRTNVTAGAHSISDTSYAPLFEFGQSRLWGLRDRAFGEPTAGSPLLGFGNDGNQSATDIRGTGHPRPAGGASALAGVGAYERANTWAKETVTPRTGSNAISVVGPGYQEFMVPVDATATTIAVYFQYDSTYAGTRPQIQIDGNPVIGVSAETVTVGTGALNDWAQASLTEFTPTAKGVVTVRLISNDTNGGGKAFADDFSVT